jgi:hypothetical protein
MGFRRVGPAERTVREVITTYRLARPGFDGSLVDEKGTAFARLAVLDTAQYLVRPDGYIAFRSDGRAFKQLDQYLAAWYTSAK